MNYQIFTHSIAKGQEKPNEDSFEYKVNEDEIIAAVSDGASNSIFSHCWSKKLTDIIKNNHFNFSTDEEFLKAEIMKCRENYSPVTSNNVFIQGKFLLTGSQATFSILQIKLQPNQTAVKALSIGDSYLFIIDPNNFEFETFPKINISEYSLPSLISNKFEQQVHFVKQEWIFTEKKYFLLMTDSLARWTFKICQTSSRKQFLEKLLLLTSDNLHEFITSQQNLVRPLLEKDDYTIVGLI